VGGIMETVERFGILKAWFTNGNGKKIEVKPINEYLDTIKIKNADIVSKSNNVEWNLNEESNYLGKRKLRFEESIKNIINNGKED
jgi:hypothetical protein